MPHQDLHITKGLIKLCWSAGAANMALHICTRYTCTLIAELSFESCIRESSLVALKRTVAATAFLQSFRGTRTEDSRDRSVVNADSPSS